MLRSTTFHAAAFRAAAAAGAGRGRFRSSLIDCSNVYATRDPYGGIGTFAARALGKGEVVERGIVRRLPVDGNTCPYVFTWSKDRAVWAAGSGCSVFYNAALDGTENTEMTRFFDEDRFEILALRDIAKHEQVTHLYMSIEWRECFKELRALRDSLGQRKAGQLARPTAAAQGGEAATTELVDCSKVYLQHDAFGGVGAFAAVPIKKGEIVERGVVRRLPVDGNHCPYVFTWSEDRSVWATGSGCSVFYNASLDGNENTEMMRFFEEDRFEVFATRDIQQDEEVTHLYKSIDWRECFKDLKSLRDSKVVVNRGASGKVL